MFEISVSTKRGSHVTTVRCVDSRCNIGKGKENLIVLQGWKVSSVHAMLEERQDGIYIVDCDSRTGVYVNQVKAKKHGPLKSDDTIYVGDYQIRVKSAGRNVASEAEARPSSNGVGLSNGQTGPDERQASESEENTVLQLYAHWRGVIREQLLSVMDLRRINVSSMSDEELRNFTRGAIEEILAKSTNLPPEIDREEIARQVLAEAIGLGPLETLLARDEISEIMVNAKDEIFYEDRGRLRKSKVTFTDDKAVISAIERIVAPLGRRIDESSPMVDARLPDGSRVNAVIPPLALKGPSITIRKFMKERLTTDRLVEFGSISPDMVTFIKTAVVNKRNIVISGGTGSGKTTLLNVLSNFIPEDERIITVEDAAELKLWQPNLVALEARPANQEGKGLISIRDLVKNCLRMRPDRIVVGECRGGEALDMLQAMNTGHDGSLTTIHANSPRDCVSRLEVLVLMSGIEMPLIAIREQIASAVHLIIQQTRFSCGSRRVTSISEITGIDSNIVQIAEIFKFKQEGFDADGRVRGKFVATGVVPEFYEDLSRRGLEVDLSIFNRDREL